MSLISQRLKNPSIKYIGNAEICSRYVPFAKDKVKKLAKKFKCAALEKSYTMDIDAIVQIRVTRTHSEITITASEGLSLTFSGFGSESENGAIQPQERFFRTNGIRHEYIGYNDTWKYPKPEWRNDNIQTLAGVAFSAYQMAITDYYYSGPFFDGTYDSNVTVYNNKSPNKIYDSYFDRPSEASGSGWGATSAAEYENFIIGVTNQGLVTWESIDYSNRGEIQLTFPSWVGEEVFIINDNGAGHRYFHGWLYEGYFGITWNFNSDGTKIVGQVFEIVFIGDDQEESVSTDTNSRWDTIPHTVIVELNPIVIGNSLTFSPVVTVGGREPFTSSVDWYYLEYEKDDNGEDTKIIKNDILSFLKITYKENYKGHDDAYRAELRTRPLDSSTETVHSSFVLEISDREWEEFFELWRYRLFFRMKVSGINLRYHTFSILTETWGTTHDNDDNYISLAKGFDEDTWINTIGNGSESYLDYSSMSADDNPATSWETPPLDRQHLFTGYGVRYLCNVYYGGYGNSCSAIDKNGTKYFAYMSLASAFHTYVDQKAPTGVIYYDAIKIKNNKLIKEFTHTEIFEKFGFYQVVTDPSKNILIDLYHVFGRWGWYYEPDWIVEN